MPTIELKDLKLGVEIGTHTKGQVQPLYHLLDLKFEIDERFVLIDQDSMDKVFDYDPLIADLERLSANKHFNTQEKLLTEILELCRKYSPPLESVEVYLRKYPVSSAGGTLGLRHKTHFMKSAP
jgi:dihydroneopterin aldolase